MRIHDLAIFFPYTCMHICVYTIYRYTIFTADFPHQSKPMKLVQPRQCDLPMNFHGCVEGTSTKLTQKAIDLFGDVSSGSQNPEKEA